ncbi:phosphoserine phosphatase SerB [Glutamicibacter sp.]|uniref:phosphoserine phosphatase SerB n=1 Tax=Glutamicibacter sp. TaxID=1931995 RepID=UPI0028BE9996|nr:phosphoserine phosphatase SerB [Glutamicibacter sp.]
MASTLVFVSRPAFAHHQLTELLDRAKAQGLIPADARVSIRNSSDRLVAKSPVLDIEHETLSQAAHEFVAAAIKAGDIRESDVCVAAIDSDLTQSPQMLLVMDVDSTLIKQEVIELLAAHAGREAEVAAVTEAAMRGELDFAQSLIQRVATLKGLPVSVLDEVGQRIIFSDGARDLVQRFHAAGHKVGVVSGGFQQILDPLAEDLRLNHALANTLGIADGVLDGTVHGDIVDRSTKEKMLRAWAAEHGIDMHSTIAAGDGANDLDMVTAAALGVAFNAKPALREQADVQINFSRLDVIADLVLNDLN